MFSINLSNRKILMMYKENPLDDVCIKMYKENPYFEISNLLQDS